MKVLLVGGGGREHALAWRLRQDDPTIEIIAAPGNPGIAELARCEAISATDVEALANLAARESVGWTLVGPEAPLAAGIVDTFRARGLAIFGPTRAAAALETSKAFAKALMHDAGVPTARARTCETVRDAHDAIADFGAPVVVKASGLAAGKGVIVCETADDARAAAASMLEGNAFGSAGATILVEEFMTGEELSVFALTDGERVALLPPAQDHKRLLEGDEGPNTGGMGAYSPVSIVDDSPELLDTVMATIIRPTLAEMRRRGTAFTGVLYVGLMLTADGPRVVEFNCRFGDPETEAVLPILAADESITATMRAIANGEPMRDGVRFRATGSAATTVVASAGYPEKPRVGDRIELPPAPANVIVFHAGTKRGESGLVTAGGRVLAITAVAPSLDEAQRASQEYAGRVAFAGKQFRPDIAWRELARRAGAT